MRVLTIDTATTTAAIGLVVDGVAIDAPPIRAAAAAQHVLATVDATLSEHGITIDQIDQIIVGRGPGSFTGQRIGLATAVGLAAPHATDLVGVTTTTVLREAAGANAVAVIDARRGEVFAEGPDLALAACTAEELAARLAPGTLVVGDGARLQREGRGEQPARLLDGHRDVRIVVEAKHLGRLHPANVTRGASLHNLFRCLRFALLLHRAALVLVARPVVIT